MRSYTVGMDDAPVNLDDAIEQTLKAYEVLYNESLALDFVGVSGGSRQVILDDKYFQTKVRQLRAKKYYQEIKDIEATLKKLEEADASEDAEDDSAFPVRGMEKKGKKAKENSQINKEILNFSIRLKELSRKIQNLDASSEGEADEKDAFNVYFHPLTKEDYERMETVEIAYPSPHVAGNPFELAAKERPKGSGSATDAIMFGDGFIQHPDGSIEEILDSEPL